MQRTIFTTPGVNTVLRAVSIGFLRLTGWTLDGQAPAGHPKCVLIAAPHTSNWDLPYTLMVAFALRMNIHWMGKRQIFRWPFGGLMRWLGGIAVDRSQSTNLVAASAKALRDAEGSVHLVIPPEGTRSQTRHWKTGFYWIAHGAGVPIMLGYLDFAKKEGGFDRMFWPTGDIDKDMVEIKQFYAGVTGCKPQNFHAAE